MTDWIDGIRDERQHGTRRPLTQAQHNAVNARYPGCTVKSCAWCGAPIDDEERYCSRDCIVAAGAEAEEDEDGRS